MFYESIHSAGERYLRLLDENRDFSFPLHLHTSFELLCVEEGEMTVTVGGLDFPVRAGECALILPGQPHAYRTEQHSLCRICIFSTDHLPDLHRYAADRCHVPVFPQPGEDFIGRIAGRKDDIFRLKALLYEVAGAYAAGEVCPALSGEDDSLVCGIVNYIEEHYTGQLTLKMLAEHFGYNYRYLSGVINQAFRMNFARVLTQYRISRACALLKQGGLTIAEVAVCSGFATQRNFNRAFRAMTGKSPKEYLSDTKNLLLHSQSVVHKTRFEKEEEKIMAERPVFVPAMKAPFTDMYPVEFQWSAGLAVSQKQKNITALHAAFRRRFPERKVLEISSKSLQPEGVKLSAFNLKKFLPSLGKEVSIECIYQGGKVFTGGGPYTDLYEGSSKDAKRDSRLKESGDMKAFYYEGEMLPLRPLTAFYDWLYISALMETPELAEEVLKYDAFTDIEYNPNKSLNCQARAAAMFVALHRAGLLDRVGNYGEFLKLYTR